MNRAKLTRLRQALIIALGAGLALGMVLLGLWQLDVYHQQGVAASARRAAAPAVPLARVARPAAAVVDGYGRSVSFTGTYDPSLQMLLPDKDPSTGFRVLTALRQPDGSIVPVVRGVVRTASAPAPPAGGVQQTGLLLPSEDAADPRRSGDVTSVRLPALAQQWPSPLIDGFVILSAPDAQSQGLSAADVQLPEAGGRFRNGAYAVQWWLFAAFALTMAVRMARDFGRLQEGSTEIGAGSTAEPT